MKAVFSNRIQIEGNAERKSNKISHMKQSNVFIYLPKDKKMTKAYRLERAEKKKQFQTLEAFDAAPTFLRSCRGPPTKGLEVRTSLTDCFQNCENKVFTIEKL